MSHSRTDYYSMLGLAALSAIASVVGGQCANPGPGISVDVAPVRVQALPQWHCHCHFAPHRPRLVGCCSHPPRSHRARRRRRRVMRQTGGYAVNVCGKPWFSGASIGYTAG